MTPGDREPVGDGLRFATHAEAEAYVKDLMWRWTAVLSTHVVETPDPVNYRWDPTRQTAVMIPLEEAATTP